MSRTSRPDKRPPSRLRYEESHPVVALRLPLDVYRRFKEATATGATAAAWVKEHLDRDDVGSEAIAEALAREKDGLGREVERRRKELDTLDALVNKQRDDELGVSREAERAKMLKEVVVERGNRLESIASEAQLTRQLRMANLAGLDADIAARKKELGRLVGGHRREAHNPGLDRARSEQPGAIERAPGEEGG